MPWGQKKNFFLNVLVFLASQVWQGPGGVYIWEDAPNLALKAPPGEGQLSAACSFWGPSPRPERSSPQCRQSARGSRAEAGPVLEAWLGHSLFSGLTSYRAGLCLSVIAGSCRYDWHWGRLGGVLEYFLLTFLRLCVQLGPGRGDPLGERRFAGFLRKALAGFPRMTPPPQTHAGSSYSGWGGRAAPTLSLPAQLPYRLSATSRIPNGAPPGTAWTLAGRPSSATLSAYGSPSGVPAASRGNERRPRAAAILFLVLEGPGGEATAARLPVASGASGGTGRELWFHFRWVSSRAARASVTARRLTSRSKQAKRTEGDANCIFVTEPQKSPVLLLEAVAKANFHWREGNLDSKSW